MVSLLDGLPNTESAALPPETEEGNIEYKLKLTPPTPERLQHLVTVILVYILYSFNK